MLPGTHTQASTLKVLKYAEINKLPGCLAASQWNITSMSITTMADLLLVKAST